MTAPYLFYETEGEEDQSLPDDSVIVGEKAYSLEYLDITVEAQKNVVTTRRNKGEVYYKEIINGNPVLYDMDGNEVADYSKLPTEVEYYADLDNPQSGDNMNVLKAAQGITL